MQQYRLLRNNKETGPHQYQDLIDLPLKAYDLVWIEGKSATWKYPSEIEELAPWSPPAPEDIYQRLHPKRIESSVLTKQQPSINAHDSTKTRRYVSVIYPVGNTGKAIPTTQDEKAIDRKPEELSSPALNFNDSPESQQVSRFYVAGALLILLAGGIYFGTSDHPFSKTVEQVPIETATGLIMQTSTPVNDEKNTPEKRLSQVDDKIFNPEVIYTVDPVKKESTIATFPSNPSLDFAALQRFVEIQPQKFHVGLFGGISNLRLNVKNSGKDPLNDIVVAIDFIQKNKSIHHTEHVKVSSLYPNQIITVTVPESQFGIAIRTRVIGINGISKH